MELKIKDGVIEFNGVELKSRKIRIEDGKAMLYLDYTELPINEIKHLASPNLEIVKDGKLVLACNNDCANCPMCEKYRFDIYSAPSRFTMEWGYKCAKKSRYAETLEDLPNSRIKYASDIEIRKGFDVIKQKFYRKSRNTVTKETIKEVIEELDSALTPNMAENWDEYGHSRIELNDIDIRQNRYGYILSYYGRMGDYGLNSEVYIHKNCDVQLLKQKLRDRYYRKYRTDVTIYKK